MPGKNTIRHYDFDSYYHIYNRGVNKQDIFVDKDDYAVFLHLLKRYLSREKGADSKGRQYACLREELELLAFCLMPNHFHLLVYQKNNEAITKLMRAVAASYTMYFNKKYNRVGHLFQDKFKASWICDEAYLLHISRYIHLNPGGYLQYEWSSLPYYLDKRQADWINPEKIKGLFEGEQEYLVFINDYKNYQDTLSTIEHTLANK